MTKRRMLIVLALSALVACKKDKPAGSDFDAHAFCKATMEGGRSGCGKDQTGDGIKVSMCESTLRGALDKNKAKIDLEAAKRCAATAESGRKKLRDHRSLTDVAATFAECRGVVTGTLAEGADCISAMECKDGMVCASLKCSRPAKDGEKCTFIIDMGLSMVKSSCAEGLNCEGNVCKPRNPEGGACRRNGACANGLRCVDGKCAKAPPSAEGGACDTLEDCVEGFYCPLGGGKCTARKAAGTSCFLDDECMGFCDRGMDDKAKCVGPC